MPETSSDSEKRFKKVCHNISAPIYPTSLLHVVFLVFSGNHVIPGTKCWAHKFWNQNNRISCFCQLRIALLTKFLFRCFLWLTGTHVCLKLIQKCQKRPAIKRNITIMNRCLLHSCVLCLAGLIKPLLKFYDFPHIGERLSRSPRSRRHTKQQHGGTGMNRTAAVFGLPACLVNKKDI